MITRGAGDRDSRQLALALDNLGVDRGESVGAVQHALLAAATLARNLPAALDIYADILRRPHLPDDELDAGPGAGAAGHPGAGGRAAAEGDGRAAQAGTTRRRWASDRRGTAEGIEARHARRRCAAHYRRPVPAERGDPVGGRQRRLGAAARTRSSGCSATGRAARTGRSTPAAHAPASEHLAEGDAADADRARLPERAGRPTRTTTPPAAAVGVLSGGMSVAAVHRGPREARPVLLASARRHETFKDRGGVIGYAGTRAERAQETLDVTRRRAAAAARRASTTTRSTACRRG